MKYFIFNWFLLNDGQKIFKIKKFKKKEKTIQKLNPQHTVCPGSSDPFYIVSYYMKYVSFDRHSIEPILEVFKNEIFHI